MHVLDIEDAVAQRDRHGLQSALRLLIEFPRLGQVEGARSTTKVEELFDEVAACLQLDQAIMPDALRHAVERITGLSLEANASYAQGALLAFEYRDRWRRLHADPLTAAA